MADSRQLYCNQKLHVSFTLFWQRFWSIIMRILNYGLVAGACVNLIAAKCLSDTLRVPADYPTIQGAINAAATSDTVLVAPGMYAEAINFSGKPLLLISAGGPTATIIHPPAGVAAVTFNNRSEERRVGEEGR